MKRLICLLLALASAFSLCACGSFAPLCCGLTSAASAWSLRSRG